MVAEPSVTIKNTNYVPCGARVRHAVFGDGQVYKISVKFKEGLVDYPYLVGTSEELTFGSDGDSVYHKRYGHGEILAYHVMFDRFKTGFDPSKFREEFTMIKDTK